MNPVLPAQNSTEPEPVSSFQSEVGVPATLMSPEPVPARRLPCTFFNSTLPEPVCAFTSPWPGLLDVDVARAGVDDEAALQPGGVNAARSGSELRVLADAVILDVAGAGVGFEEGIGRSFNVVIDADVVVVLVALADANDVSGLIDRADCSRSPAPSASLPPQFDFTWPDDVDAIARIRA